MACKDKIRVAVAGCGFGANHLRGYAESELCDIVAVWSRTASNADKAAALYSVPIYTDYEKMLQELGPDIVSVAVPEIAHEAMTIAALENGCHVYCEKVLAPSVKAARRMVDKAAEKGLLLNVGYNYRYSISCRYIAEKLRKGAIGKPLFAHLRAFACCIHHMTDYVCSLLGDPVEVVSVVEKEPLPGRPFAFDELNFPTFNYTALTIKTYMVKFKNGAVLMAGATDYSNVINPAADLLIEGSEGRLMLDDLSGTVKMWTGLADPWSGVDDPKSREAIHFHPSQIRDQIGLIESCKAAVKDFARAVHAGEAAPIPGEDGIKMIQLEEGILRSARSRQWERIDNNKG